MAEAGFWSLVLTLLVSAYAVVAALVGARRRDSDVLESARNGALVAAALATFAAALLLYALFTRDYSLSYVAEHVNDVLPPVYVFSALWAGQEGSLLLWLWMVVLISAGIVLWRRAWATGGGSVGVRGNGR